MTPSPDTFDVLIIGAGAAGLAAAYFAGEAARWTGARIAVVDGARKPGAKILISGGGRCNVTNERVTPDDYFGGPRPTIRNVLRAFDEQHTIDWMRTLGVELKLEPTGKYFPVTDNARTVLDALLHGVEQKGATLMKGARIAAIERDGEEFVLQTRDGDGDLRARRIVMATGGLALPKSGSDGWGLNVARRLGHSVVPTTPALSPLVLRSGTETGGRFAEFSGLTIPARLTITRANGKVLHTFTDSTLFTHFGLSGPAALNLSRHILRARLDEPEETFRVTLGHPDFPTPAHAETWMQQQAQAHAKRTVQRSLAELFPDRLASEFATGTETWATLSKMQRKAIAQQIAALPLDVAGDRGYAFAETTAGGVNLREINPTTMESRIVPGLYFCGEMLDVDGRIGGFNFQWAWASGYLAGRAAAALNE